VNDQTSAPETSHVEHPVPASEPTYFDAPVSWPREVAERHWTTTPHELRGFLTKREFEASRKISELGSRASRYEPVQQVFDRYRQSVPELSQLEPHAALEHLLAAHQMLSTNASQGIQHLLQAYKVDPLAILPEEIRRQLDAGQISEQKAAKLEAQLKDIESRSALNEKARASQDATRAAKVNVRSAADVRGHVPRTMNETLSEIAKRRYGT
jgi:hypothetical protein